FSNPPSRHRPTVGGNYLVEATDSKGCISRDDVFINYKDTANFKLPAVPAVVCENANGFNNTYIIEAGGSYPTYTWSKDGVNFNPSIPPNKHKPNSRGTYKVTIADINGCPASDQVFVNYFVPTALKLNSNPAGNISCWNKLTTLTPTPGFNPYVWTTNNGVNIPINTGSITPKQSGTYSVVGTDLNGCKSGDQASITFVPDFNLELGDIRATCSNVTYKIDATKPNIVSYVWTTSAGVSVPDNRTSVFEVNKPGFYSVKLTDNNGCTDQDTLEVKVTDKIIVNLGADRPECFNNRVPLNATPNFAKYEWTNSAGVTNPGLTTSQFFPTKTGNYSVKVTDASGNCTDEDTVSIVFVPDFGFELKNNPNEVICYNIGGSIESKDPKYNTGYQWNWSVPSGEPQPANNVVKIDPKTSGRYIIKIVDPATLCDDRDTVDITYSNLTLGYNLGDPNKRVCFNIMDSITSTLPKFRDKSQYTWDWPLLPAQFPNSDGKTVVFPTKSGKYAARITDIYRCTALDTVDVNFISDFNSNLDKGNKFVCADSAYTLNAGPGFDYYNWQGGPQGPNLPTYTPPRKDGRYYVTVTKVGCNKKDSVDLTFVPAIKLNLNLSGDHYICYEDPGVLTVSEGFDSYTWSGSTNTTNTYTPPKVNGDYIVTVKLKTCPASDTASLTFVPDFRIAPWNPGIVCGEDSISLSGGRTGGFIFDWQDGSHDTIYYPRASGTVRLVKTDILSKCKAEQSTLIDFVTRPKDFDVPDANKCPERSITITATGSEFTRFVWGENSPNPFTTRNPGIFYVEGFTAKGNCGFKDTVTVRNFALDTLDLGYDETKPVIVCSYDRFTLHAGPEYKSYKWFPGGSEDSTFVPTSSGPQQVNVVDKNDCQQTDLMLLTINKVDKPDLGKDTILCSSTDYALLIPPNKYTFIEWNDKTSNTKYTPKGGDSLITVKVSKKLENVECFNGDSAIVRVARPFNLNIGKDTIVCSGSEFLLDPKKDYYTYDWKYTSKVILDDVNDSFLLVSQKKTLKPDTTGNYRLIVSGEFNCKDSAGIFIDYFKFTPPVPQTPSICIGETATFNGGSNYNSYIWKNTSGTIVGRAQFLSTKIGGTYTLILEKEECLIHDTTEVTLTTRALPAIRSLLNDTNTILNKRLTLCYDVDKIERILAVGDTSYQYRWSILPDTNQFVSNINVVDLQLGGTYHISVMDTTGCKFSDTVLVAFTDSCFRIPNLFTPNFDERNDKFQVKGIRANTWDLSVFNRWGDKVYYEEGYNNTWDGGNVTDGIYYYLLENPKDNKSYKGWLQIIGRKD
ncbi:MAG TPA: gliding motility-associated C-terminal domain-containing protein, partial [Cytophagaceae bacterium]